MEMGSYRSTIEFPDVYAKQPSSYVRDMDTSHSMDSPLLSPDSARQSLGFTKAAITFRDQLGSIRRKRDSEQTVTSSWVPPTPTLPAKRDSLDRSIKILRIVQSTLTALLSLAIAFMQGRVYYIFLRTKNVPGAWPKTPQLTQTLLLFSVSVSAFTFDICMLFAYLMPNKRFAKKLYRIANGAHYIVTSAKTVAYALTSVVCKLGFNFGNSSGTNTDLWSWTCTAEAAEYADYNQAPSNCDAQTIAWYFALAQIGIELIGVVISLLVMQQKIRKLGQEDGAEENASPSLGNKRYEKLAELSPEVDTELSDVTPDVNATAHF
ncbi:hypothetical protein NA57DRAFT_70138 [Rhizodiscina lignyota]|uniref:Uncharacterized protein n=1 Tax=Rhizodiscina lignyota TaxID=1504668 RepID=A0A9P4ILV1_9PEZI|nr:hypothetical protein NA57DRAFT_70138 [Rhizodiscina lignyota]